MTVIVVTIAEERLAEIEAEVEKAVSAGDWKLTLTWPEVAVLTAAYREYLAAIEVLDEKDAPTMSTGTIRLSLPGRARALRLGRESLIALVEARHRDQILKVKVHHHRNGRWSVYLRLPDGSTESWRGVIDKRNVDEYIWRRICAMENA